MKEKILENFTVIIPTVGRPILKECLRSIVEGNLLPARIILVDQGNNPAVTEWIQESKNAGGTDILHIRSKGRSPASARNEGIKQVNTPFIAAIDDDCIADAGWLETMAFCLNKNPDTIVTGRVEPAGEGIPQTIMTEAEPYTMHHLSIRNLSPLATCNMGVSLQSAQLIGGFDEDLFTAEDTDWAYRALRLGLPLQYAPEVIVHHYHWRNSSQTLSNYQAYATGLGVFYGKHLRRGDLSMVPRTILALYRGAKSLLKGWKNQDQNLTLEGTARLTKLIPGLIDGLRGIGFSRKR